MMIVSARLLDGYPGHGKPCNRCGACCRIEICVVGRSAFGHPINDSIPGPCPALERNADGTHQCGLMTHPARYVPERAATFTEPTLAAAARFILGAGDGCDMPVDGWPVDQNHERRQMAEADRLRESADAAGFVWGIARGKVS